MLTDLPTRVVAPVGLSARVATQHIYAPFGSDDPTHLAYAPGDRVAEADIPAILAAGYGLPEWGNDPPDVLDMKLKEVAKMDVAERKAYEAYPDRYAHLAEDAPTTVEVVEDSKDKMESGEIADARVTGVGTDTEFRRDNAGAPAKLNEDVDVAARDAMLEQADDAAMNPTADPEPGSSDVSENLGEKAVEKDDADDKAVTKTTRKSSTRRKPASK